MYDWYADPIGERGSVTASTAREALEMAMGAIDTDRLEREAVWSYDVYVDVVDVDDDGKHMWGYIEIEPVPPRCSAAEHCWEKVADLLDICSQCGAGIEYSDDGRFRYVGGR